MTATPQLLRHGEHVSPLYEVLPGAVAPKSTDEERPSGQGGIVERYSKHESAHSNPQALGWIKATYDDAIEYTGKTKDLRGLAFLAACWGGPLMVGFGSLGVYAPFKFSDEPLWFQLFTGVISLLISFAIPFGIWHATKMLRLDLFHLADQPIIFDRKRRKVYRLFSEQQPGIKGTFMPWPIRACEYDWDLIDAEHNAEGVITGATATANHFLMFAVRRSATDSTIIASFQVGDAMSLSDGLTNAMWEHIRRFMEEGGPHLPTANEPLASQEPPQSWWQSLGATGLFGPGYWQRWDSQPGFMTLMHLMFPLTVPMYLLWGTGNWLSYKTEIKVEWPAEVLAAVGPVRRSAVPAITRLA